MIESLSVDVSLLGVAVAALTLFILGGLWYVVLFGKTYQRELGLTEPGAGDSTLPPSKALGRALIGQLVASVLIALTLALLIGNTSTAQGILVGLTGGVLVAAALIQLYQFEGRSLKHLAINLGYMIIGLTVVGAVVGAFQAG